MNFKKTLEERRSLVSRIRTLCLRERILAGTVTRTRVGGSLRMTVTDKADGRTRTLFVPADRQEEVVRWNDNWRELKRLLKEVSELQRLEFRASVGQDGGGAGTPAQGGAPRKRPTAKRRTNG